VALLGLISYGTPLLATGQNYQSKWTAPTVGASPSALNFGSISVGTLQTKTIVITNTGSISCTLSRTATSGSGFSVGASSLPANLGAGQSVSLPVSFSPQAAGSVSGTLSLTFRYYKRRNLASMGMTVPLSGSGIGSGAGSVVPNPTALSFGTVQLGSNKTVAQSISNSGGTSVTVSQITASGLGFGTSGVSLPVTLSAGQSYTFNVTFTPTTSGPASGNLAVVSNATNSTLNVQLSGTAATQGQLSVAPGSLSFGSVIVGNSLSQTGTLAATGNSVTISSIGTSDAEFTVSGVSLPKTIAAGTSAPFTVTFTPQGTGSATGNLAFVSNAAVSPITMGFSGSGTSAPQHSVSLNWNQSSSASVVGYNIYRSNVSGGPYTKINSALDVTTSGTDSTVQAGQTYYYVVTAVDSSNGESGYSTAVGVVVPSP
jgi:hypothetical protein